MNPVSNVLAGLLESIRAGALSVIDLTHGLDEHSPYWPEGRDQPSFSSKIVSTYESRECFARDVTMSEHSGTHLDAPVHVIPGGATVDQLPVGVFLSPAYVVDVREAVATDPDYRVTVADLEGFIEAHGSMPRGCIVFFRTGWAFRWPWVPRPISTPSDRRRRPCCRSSSATVRRCSSPSRRSTRRC